MRSSRLAVLRRVPSMVRLVNRDPFHRCWSIAARIVLGYGKEHGWTIHMGRVNTRRRLALARACFADSVDGTGMLRYGSDVLDDLPEKIRTYGGVPNVTQPETSTELLTLVEVERRHIARVLKAVLGNKTQAARVLGVDRRTLYRKLEMYQVD